MSDELSLRRKWTLRAAGQQVVLVKRANERAQHVWTKALVWALYLPDYPQAKIELAIDDRFRPDVIALDNLQEPLFWGECGQLNLNKLASVARRYRDTHLAVAKWSGSLQHHVAQVSETIGRWPRTAPCDVLVFPEDAAERFVSPKGEIRISFDDIPWQRVEPDSP